MVVIRTSRLPPAGCIELASEGSAISIVGGSREMSGGTWTLQRRTSDQSRGCRQSCHRAASDVLLLTSACQPGKHGSKDRQWATVSHLSGEVRLSSALDRYVAAPRAQAQPRMYPARAA